MSYSIKVSEGFKKKFRKLDFVTQRTGNLKGLWRYQIGDYRLIVDILDEELVIIAVDIGHRREVYR